MDTRFLTQTRPRLQSLLAQFTAAAKPTIHDYRWSHHHDGKRHDTHIVFGCMVHGDEHGSLPAIVALVEALNNGSLDFGGRLSVFIGNPEAGLENVRYLEADLNRVFLDTGHGRHEDLRARQLMPILEHADVFIDFHQTILETQHPFYIFPWNKTGWHWARAVSTCDTWVTRDPSHGFSSGSKCGDEYVVDRGRTGITLELSAKGFNDRAEALCWQTICNTLALADTIHAGDTIATLAGKKPDLQFYQTTFAQRFDSPQLALKPGLVNFQAVTRGQKLHTASSPAITVPADGMLLFPKYPNRVEDDVSKSRPNEIYRLINKMKVHPQSLWGG